MRTPSDSNKNEKLAGVPKERPMDEYAPKVAETAKMAAEAWSAMEPERRAEFLRKLLEDGDEPEQEDGSEGP